MFHQETHAILMLLMVIVISSAEKWLRSQQDKRCRRPRTSKVFRNAALLIQLQLRRGSLPGTSDCSYGSAVLNIQTFTQILGGLTPMATQSCSVRGPVGPTIGMQTTSSLLPGKDLRR